MIDLYQYHRPDPNVPYAETVGAFSELQDEGKVRWVGLSNATSSSSRRRSAIAEIVAVQNQLALDFTSPLAKGEVEACTRARASRSCPGRRSAASARRAAPPTSTRCARRPTAHGVSPQQVALAWLLSLGPTVIPIPGSSRPETITDSARAAELELSREELDAITEAATK